MNRASSENAFTVERHGDVCVILASPAVESLEPGDLEAASSLLLSSVATFTPPLLLVDLREVKSFGSAFLALLIRLWKNVSAKAGMMALSGVSPTVRELLRMTKLDTVWPIYDRRSEAIEALQAD